MGKFQEGWVVVPEVRCMRETVYGVKTHYVHAGEGEPVVLLHGGGAGGSGEHGWYNLIPALAEHFHVYALDQLGYGETDKPLTQYSFQALVNHVAGFIDILTLNQVRIGGNSQGGYVAMKYTLDFPERVKQVFTIASGTLASAMEIGRAPDGSRIGGVPDWENSKESMRRFMTAIVNDPAKVTEELIESRWRLSQLPGAPEAKASILAYRKLVEVVDPDPLQWQVFSVRHRLPKLTLPWCVIWGADDKTAPLPLAHELRELCPNITEFHVVEGAGHQVQNDKPEVFNPILLRFLRADVAAAAAR